MIAEEEKKVVSSVVLRETLEKLGPTFMKLGQILSLRSDIVGEEIAEELSKLQSSAYSFSFDQVSKTLSGELKKPVEEIFKSIEKSLLVAF